MVPCTLIRKGNGKITINDRDIDDYFGLETLKLIVRQPLALTETGEKLDVVCRINGGGVTGQAGAIRHGIARAFQYDKSLRPALKKAEFLLVTKEGRKKRNRVSKKLSCTTVLKEIICLSKTLLLSGAFLCFFEHEAPNSSTKEKRIWEKQSGGLFRGE